MMEYCRKITCQKLSVIKFKVHVIIYIRHSSKKGWAADKSIAFTYMYFYYVFSQGFLVMLMPAKSLRTLGRAIVLKMVMHHKGIIERQPRMF